MIYWKYLSSLIIGFVIGSFLFILAVFSQLGYPTFDSDWSYEVYQHREHIVKIARTPKLLILGGSNSSFGISCEMIEKQTEVPCINSGTNLNIAIDYMLYRGKRWLSSGDLVLMTLELNHYDDQGIPTETFVDHVIANDPNYLTQVDGLSKLRFIFGVSLKRLQDGWARKNRIRPNWEQGKIAQNYNSFGDRVDLDKSKITPEFLKKIETAKPINLNWRYIQSSSGMEAIEEFVDWCRHHEIQVLAAWPNMMKFEIYQDHQHQEFFQSIEDFYQRLNVPLLGTVEDFMYDKSWLFDGIVYHLNAEGVKVHTMKVIKLLNPYLKHHQSE